MIERIPTQCRFLMCPPQYFGVTYSINPWMDPSIPVNTVKAAEQWKYLLEIYRSLGHIVETIKPMPGLPDMTFSANAAVVVDNRVLTARFRFPERALEQELYRRWFARHNYEVCPAEAFCEGEGDVIFAGPLALVGWGFRTTRDAHEELQDFFGRPVLGLRLVDPRFYHLDTALCVFDAETIAYYPQAFSRSSRRTLEKLFPDAIRVEESEAVAFGLNAVSDGYHVVIPESAQQLPPLLRDRGFKTIPIDVSEFNKAGGSAKCLTLRLRHE